MKPGDVVIGAFPGAMVTKVRPGVVLSSTLYQRQRPDVIVGIITTQAPPHMAESDSELIDWSQAGLHSHSFFRLYAVTLPQRDVRVVGALSVRDWSAVRGCLASTFAMAAHPTP